MAHLPKSQESDHTTAMRPIIKRESGIELLSLLHFTIILCLLAAATMGSSLHTKPIDFNAINLYAVSSL